MTQAEAEFLAQCLEDMEKIEGGSPVSTRDVKYALIILIKDALERRNVFTFPNPAFNADFK